MTRQHESWARLERELEAWRHAGRRASLWWRDDDATAPGGALDRLLGLAERLGLPLSLAVVPADAAPALAARLAGSDATIDVLQHGWAHANHAAPGAKKSELGPERPLELRLDELTRGRQRLRELFGPRALPVLVPPWNRLADDLPARLAGIGLHGLSTFGPRPRDARLPARVNCHLDILRWRPRRGFVGEAAALGSLCDHLAARRTGAADPGEPTGIMSHHLVHDAPAWRFLEQLLTFLAGRPEALFLSARQAFGARPGPAREAAGAAS